MDMIFLKIVVGEVKILGRVKNWMTIKALK